MELDLSALCGWITKENADVVGAWTTIVGVAAALLAALFAGWQLRMIGKDSRDRTRPYVQLDVVPGIQGPGSWDLIIENRGASAALQVVIDGGEFEPQDEKDHITPELGKYLLRPQTLVPTARRRVMWAYSNNELKIQAGVLEPRDVKVSYLDERKAKSRLGRRSPYTDTFTLDGALGGAVFPSPSEGPVPNSKDMLKHIDSALRTLNVHVGELRR